ncbi:hypothetical protein HYW46_01465 [Candidatus Daviesbacteria bacterium]|nr:hypothetical protein [Candidatus Daviesbacteria bacterium]
MTKHLAVFSKEAVQRIFEGKKTVESRFSQHKIAPFGSVGKGDLVYIKPAGGEIAGQFLVKKVISFENLDGSDWQIIRFHFGKKLSLGNKGLDDKFFKIHKDAKYGTLIFIDRVEQFITSPIKISKKDQRGWMVL